MVTVKGIAEEKIANNMTPSELIHPGEMIKDEIIARGLTQKEIHITTPNFVNKSDGKNGGVKVRI